MDLDLLTEIIEAFKVHQLALTDGKKTTMAEFTSWLNEKQFTIDKPYNPEHMDIIGAYEIDSEIAKLVIFLNRYAKSLLRKGLSTFPELVNEDFTYLYALMACESMTKIQLIEKNIHEKPMGLEVIKRLLKNELIAEREDENDKRSKRVFLTKKGTATFFATIDHMKKVCTLLTGNLTIEEKNALFGILKKLEDFHNPLFLLHRKKSIEEMQLLQGVL